MVYRYWIIVALICHYLSEVSSTRNFDQGETKNELFSKEDRMDMIRRLSLGRRALSAILSNNSTNSSSNTTTTPSYVECYDCSGCPKVDDKTPIRRCPPSYDPFTKSNCVTYTERPSYMSEPFVIRGCTTDKGSCSLIRRYHERRIELVDCKQCTGAICNANGDTKSNANVTLTMMALVFMSVLFRFRI